MTGKLLENVGNAKNSLCDFSAGMQQISPEEFRCGGAAVKKAHHRFI
jgi:hypothetical protein